jgi:ElaB/YqjD/DUF883 family membrane-anchored ribosome-binding protein
VKRRASGRLPPPSVPANFFCAQPFKEVIEMTFEETANSSVRSAMDQGRQAADKASQVIQDGYDAAQQYAKDRGVDFDLRELVRREPWFAIAAAFAVGYVVAQIVRKVS